MERSNQEMAADNIDVNYRSLYTEFVAKQWIVFLVALLAAIVVLWLSYGREAAPFVNGTPPPQPQITPTPTLSKENRSGDGTMVLKMSGVRFPDGQTNYYFRVFNRKEDSEWLVYSITTAPGEVMDLPHNAWSPNNKQFFIELDGLGEKKFYVFKADGTDYRTGEHHLDVMSYWQASKNKFQVETITGWGGIDLLVIKTNKDDGSTGPSFWFVTSSRGFLRLRS